MTPDDLDLATWAKQRFHEKLLDLLICPSVKGLLIEIKHYFIGIGDVIDAKLPKQLRWAYIAIRPSEYQYRYDHLHGHSDLCHV